MPFNLPSVGKCSKIVNLGEREKIAKKINTPVDLLLVLLLLAVAASNSRQKKVGLTLKRDYYGSLITICCYKITSQAAQWPFIR
jgi:hypothetical protein